jgi:E-phenylitaconyl-CoA hydratase
MIEYSQTDHIVTIRINNPKKLNAVTDADLDTLLEYWKRFRDDDSARVAVLTGAGERSFCAGNDVGELPGESADQRAEFWRRSHHGYYQTLEDGFHLWKPVIAAINGYCLGEGLVMTLGADIRICSSSAKFSMPEVSIGINTVTGAYLLPRIVGASDAARILLTGDRFDADEALRIGLVSAIYPPSELMSGAYELAARIARNAPLAVRATKEVMVRGRRAELSDMLAAGEALRELVRTTSDFREGMAAFSEKRSPDYSGK